MTEHDTMRPLDCTDIKAVLSGLLDGELPPETRHEAERHLAECAACRAMLNENEALGDLILRDVEDAATDVISPEFVGAVLSRTVYAERQSNRARWTNWLGWFAAAAAVALAASIWFMDRGFPTSDELVEGSSSAQSGTRNAHLVSTVSDGVIQPNGMFAIDDNGGTPADLRAGSPITRDDAETFDAVAMILDILVNDAHSDQHALEEIRQIAAYDDLLPRLVAARSRLELSDRAVADAGEVALFLILQATADHDLQKLRTIVGQIGLADDLRALSNRWYHNQAL